MKITSIIITSLFSITFAFCQKEDVEYSKKIGIGIYLGESSGINVSKQISNSMSFQWNIGINELFSNYNFTNKYNSYRTNQSYNNIYSSSIGIIYRKNVTRNSPFTYRGILGGQFRVISRYSYQLLVNNSLPNTVIINDPITTNKFDMGVNYFIGLGYKINEHLNLSVDIGGYSEITDTFLWTNPQFRIGIDYLFIKTKNKKITS